MRLGLGGRDLDRIPLVVRLLQAGRLVALVLGFALLGTVERDLSGTDGSDRDVLDSERRNGVAFVILPILFGSGLRG